MSLDSANASSGAGMQPTTLNGSTAAQVVADIQYLETQAHNVPKGLAAAGETVLNMDPAPQNMSAGQVAQAGRIEQALIAREDAPVNGTPAHESPRDVSAAGTDFKSKLGNLGISLAGLNLISGAENASLPHAPDPVSPEMRESTRQAQAAQAERNEAFMKTHSLTEAATA